MERSKHESVASLLEDHPLPWTIFPGSIRPGESWIADSNGRSIIGIRTSGENHEAVLELLRHTLPDKMPELDISDSQPIAFAIADIPARLQVKSLIGVERRFLTYTHDTR